MKCYMQEDNIIPESVLFRVLMSSDIDDDTQEKIWKRAIMLRDRRLELKRKGGKQDFTITDEELLRLSS